jgi:hypothetical protein
MQHSRAPGPGPLSGLQGPGNFYRLPPPVDVTEYFGRSICSVLFIKFEDWLQCSIQLGPGTYAKPMQFRVLSHTLLKIHIHISKQSTPWSSKCLSYYQVYHFSYQFSHAWIFIVVSGREVRKRVGPTWHTEHPTLSSVWKLTTGISVNHSIGCYFKKVWH